MELSLHHDTIENIINLSFSLPYFIDLITLYNKVSPEEEPQVPPVALGLGLGFG